MSSQVEGGRKDDSSKLRYDLIPTYGLEQIAAVYTMGAAKYDDRNWQKGIRFSRLHAAMMRHLEKHRQGEDLDAESGLSHLAHIAWYCFAMMDLGKYLPEMDDRMAAFQFGPENVV